MSASDDVQIAPEPSGSRASDLSGAWKYFHQTVCVAFALFALWAAGPGIPEDNLHLGIFTLVMWVMSFLVYPGRKGTGWETPGIPDWGVALPLVALLATAIYRAEGVSEEGALASDWAVWAGCIVLGAFSLARPRALNLALMGLACLCLNYFVSNYLELQERPGAWHQTDFWMAFTAIVLALEAARRGLGLWIPAIAVIALLFAHFGAYAPGQLAHRGSTVHQIVNYTFYSQEGIFGVMTSVMASYVLIFIYLGAFMNQSGMGKFFIDMPMALAGRTAGGPAKVAVIASAIFGSISGSSIANIVSTGTFTIPLMKKVGFRSPRGGRGGKQRFAGRPVAAARDGFGRVRDGGDNGRALRPHHGHRRRTRAALSALDFRHRPFRGEAVRHSGNRRG